MLEVEEKSLVSQYNGRTFRRGKWIDVVRYDSGHGFSHRDQYDNRGRAIYDGSLFAFRFNEALHSQSGPEGQLDRFTDGHCKAMTMQIAW